MKCPKCSAERSDQSVECINCGLIFEKYRKVQELRSDANDAKMEYEEVEPVGKVIWRLLFYVKPETNPLLFAGRVLFFVIIFIWGLKFIFTPMDTDYTMQSFWHLVNLPFHEAGHVIFRPLGRFMTSLGGSLGQVLMPLTCLAVFLIKAKDPFGASFSLWWTGQNFMDLAPYINDARSLTLPLLGGNTGQTSPYGFHDWEFILKESGLLRYDHALANFSYKLGAALMIVSFSWGIYVLFRQYRNLSK